MKTEVLVEMMKMMRKMKMMKKKKMMMKVQTLDLQIHRH